MFITLQHIFKEVFNNPDLLIQPDTAANEIAEWDSFNHVVLVASIEEHFGVTFSADEMVSLSSVDLITEALRSKGIDMLE